MAKKDTPAADTAADTKAAAPAGVDADKQVGDAAQTGVTTLGSTMLADAAAGHTGFEEADAQAFAIPFMQILQSGSPQCKRSEGAYIDGAAEGMFFNTVLQTLYPGEDRDDVKGGIILIPCHYSQRFIEWKDRDSGGGFVAEHKPTDAIVLTTVKDDENRDRLPNGNILVDTRNHYCLHLDPAKPGEYTPVIISMSSTQLKKSRNWMSKMQQLKLKAGAKLIPAPMASHKYMATTVPEKNDKGTWMGWQISLVGPLGDDEASLYQAAQEFRAAVVKGTMKAAVPAQPSDDTAPSNF